VLVVAAFVLVVDQTTKVLALHHLSEAPRHIFGPFGLQLTYNSGSAFSLLQGSTGPLLILDLALVAVLGWLGFRATTLLMRLGLGMILGGALGNITDRLVHHHGTSVVDFISLSHWPTFNAADSAITIGAIIVVIAVLTDSRHDARSQAADD